jgi:predicted nucleic acid-binding protein
MKLVVDTNILFSFFWKDSFTCRLLKELDLELISPIFALEEVKKYRLEIMKKTKLSISEFNTLVEDLKKYVLFISEKDYNIFKNKSLEFSPDKGDIDFFALCLKEKCFLWSNDFLLKEQDKVEVLSTKELVNILF